MTGSDYAGLPTSSLWPCSILTIEDGKSRMNQGKMGKLLYLPPLTNHSACGKVSLKSLEITNDSRAVSYQLSAVT